MTQRILASAFLFILFFATTAFAQGTLTNTNVQPADLSAGATGDVQITFTATNGIPADGIIIITFPAGFDCSSVGANLTDAQGNLETVIPAAVILDFFDAQKVEVHLSDAVVNAGDPVDFTISNIKNPTSAGSTGVYGLETQDSGNNMIDDDTAVAADTITGGGGAGTLTNTDVEPLNLAAGVTGDVQVTFTTVGAIPASGKILVTFPSGFNVSSATLLTDNEANLGTTPVVSKSGQVVTVTLDTDSSVMAADNVGFVLTNVTNPGTGGSTGVYGLETQDASNTKIDEDTAVAADTITGGGGGGGALGFTAVALQTPFANATGEMAFTFVTTSAVPASGKIVLTFPAEIVPGGTMSVASDTGANLGTSPTVSVSGQTVTVTLDGDGGIGPGGTADFALASVTNGGTAGPTGTFGFETQDASSTKIDEDTNVAGEIILASGGTLTSTDVQPASLVENVNGSVNVTFVATNGLAPDSILKVTFPAGFDVSAVSATITDNNANLEITTPATVSVSSQVVSVQLTSANVAPGSTVDFDLGNITNPSAGSPGTYGLATEDGLGNGIDTGTAAGDTFTSTAGLSGVLLSVSPSTTSSSATMSATFTQSGSGLSATDTITVKLTDYTLPVGPVTVTSGSGVTGALSGLVSSGSTDTLVVTLDSGASIAAGTPATFTFPVTNPAIAKTVAKAGLTIATSTVTTPVASAADIVISAAPALSGVNISVSPTTEATSTTATVKFTQSPTGISTGSTITVKMTGYTFATGGIAVTGTGFSTGSTFAGIVAGGATDTVVVTLTGTLSAGTEGTLSFTATNPAAGTIAKAGLTVETTQVTTAVASDADIVISAPATGALTSTSIEPLIRVVSVTSPILISFTTTSAIPATGKIAVTFPGVFDVSNATFGDDNNGNLDSPSVGISGQTVTLTLGGASSVGAAGSVSFTLDGIRNPSSAGAGGDCSIETQDASSTKIDEDATVTSGGFGAAGALGGTNVEPQSLVAGSSDSVQVTFTTSNPMPDGGKVLITFPAGFDVSGVGASIQGGPKLGTGTSVSVSGQVVTVQAGTGVTVVLNDLVDFTLSGIQVPAVSGSTGNYAIEIQDSMGVTIDQDASVPASVITPGALTSTSVTPALLVAGVDSNVTIAFTTTNAIPANGVVYVTFPSGFDISSLQYVSNSGNVSGVSAGVTQQVVDIQFGSGVAAGEAVSVTYSQLINPSSPGATSDFMMQSKDGAAVIDEDNAVPGVTITSPGALTSTSVTPATLVAGANTSCTIQLTTANLVPASGHITVTFPSGFDVSGAAFGTDSAGNLGTSGNGRGVTVSSQAVTITLGSDGGVSAGGTVAFTLSGIVNPGVSGSSGTYSIETRATSGGTIDEDTAVTASSFTAGTLTSTDVQPGSLMAGALSDVRVTFTSGNAIPASGVIVVTFPAGFDHFLVSSQTQTDNGANLGSGVAVSANGQEVTVVLGSDGGVNSNELVDFTIKNIYNPEVSGSTGTYAIETRNGSQVKIDEDTSVAADTLTAETLLQADVAPDSLVAGATGDIRVTFVTPLSLPASGKIVVTFPSGFDVSGIGSTDVTDNSNQLDLGTAGNGFGVSASGQVVTLTLGSDGLVSFSSEVDFTLANVTNPGVAGLTGTYAIETQISSGAKIAEDAAVAADTITPGALSSTDVELQTPYPSTSTFARVRFTTANEIPSGGKIFITFPAGFSLNPSGGVLYEGAFNSNLSVDAAQGLLVPIFVGAVIPAGSDVDFTLDRITTPSSSGLTGTYQFESRTGSDSTIDQDSAVAGDSIVGALANPTITHTIEVVGATYDARVTFTTTQAIPSGGKIVLTFPSGFDVSGINSFIDGDGVLGNDADLSVSGQEVTLILGANDSIGAGESVGIDLLYSKNPSVDGATGTYQIETQNASGDVLDRDLSVPANQIVPVQTFNSVGVALETQLAGATGKVTVSLNPNVFVPDRGKILIAFPSGFDVSNVGIANDTDDGLGAFATISASGQIVEVELGDNASGIVSLQEHSLVLRDVVNPTDFGPTGTFSLETQDAFGATLETSSGIAGEPIRGALTETSVEPTSILAGATGTVDVKFTTTQAVAQGGRVVVTFPSGFDLTNVAYDAGDPGVGNSNATTTVNGQTVTVEVVGLNADYAHGFTLKNVKNPTAVGTTGTYSIKTEDASGNPLDTDPAVDGTLIVLGLLTGTDVEPDSLVVSEKGDVQVNFTTENAVPAGGKVEVTFPNGFTVTDTAFTGYTGPADSTFGTSPEWTISGQVVTITLDPGDGGIAAGASGSILLEKIINPGVSGVTGTYRVETQDANGDPIDVDPEVAGDRIAGLLTGADVIPASLNAGATGRVDIGFTTTNAIPSDGEIVVTFPEGFDVSAATWATLGSNITVAQLVLDGSARKVTLVLSGSTVGALQSLSFALDGIMNPETGGAAGTYSIEIVNADDEIVDAAPSVTGDTFVDNSGTLRNVSITPSNSYAGVTVDFTVMFQTASFLSSNSSVQVTFPEEFDLSRVGFQGCSSSHGIGFSRTGQVVTINLDDTLRKGTVLNLVLTRVKTPTTTERTGTFSIATFNSNNVVIDRALSVPGRSFSNPNPGSRLGAASSSSAAGATVSMDFTVTPATNVSQDNLLILTFPAGYDASSATLDPTGTTPQGLLALESASSQAVRLRFTSGFTEGAELAIRLNNIVNPIGSGTYGLVDASIDDSFGTYDFLTAVAVQTLPGLDSLSFRIADRSVSTMTAVNVSFVLDRCHFRGGDRILVTFPDGFNVAGATFGAWTSDFGEQGATVATSSGQTVTVVPSSYTSYPQKGDTLSFRIEGIVNPGSKGPSGEIEVLAELSAGDQAGVVAGPVNAVPLLKDVSVNLSNPTPGSVTQVELAFDASVNWPENGYMLIEFENWLSSQTPQANWAISSGVDGTLSLVWDYFPTGRLARITRNNDGDGNADTGAMTFTLSGLLNPDAAGKHQVRISLWDQPSGNIISKGETTVSVTAVPTLSFVGTSGYQTDGAHPDSVSGSGEVVFKVVYKDPEGEAPRVAKVWVDLDADGDYETGEALRMIPAGSGTPNYASGVIYHVTWTPIFPGGNASPASMKYKFVFLESDGAAPTSADGSTSDPAGTLTVTAPPSNPSLTDVTESGFVNGANSSVTGGNVANEGSGDTMTFKVIYTDPDGTAPTRSEVHISLDGDNDKSYDSSERFVMSWDGTGTGPTADQVRSGATYAVSGLSFSALLADDVRDGDRTLDYVFRFSNGEATATGTPASERQLQVNDTLPFIVRIQPDLKSSLSRSSTGTFFSVSITDPNKKKNAFSSLTAGTTSSLLVTYTGLEKPGSEPSRKPGDPARIVSARAIGWDNELFDSVTLNPEAVWVTQFIRMEVETESAGDTAFLFVEPSDPVLAFGEEFVVAKYNSRTNTLFELTEGDGTNGTFLAVRNSSGQVVAIVYAVVDNGDLDSDSRDNIIVDPIGIGVLKPATGGSVGSSGSGSTCFVTSSGAPSPQLWLLLIGLLAAGMVMRRRF